MITPGTTLPSCFEARKKQKYSSDTASCAKKRRRGSGLQVGRGGRGGTGAKTPPVTATAYYPTRTRPQQSPRNAAVQHGRPARAHLSAPVPPPLALPCGSCAAGGPRECQVRPAPLRRLHHHNNRCGASAAQPPRARRAVPVPCPCRVATAVRGFAASGPYTTNLHSPRLSRRGLGAARLAVAWRCDIRPARSRCTIRQRRTQGRPSANQGARRAGGVQVSMAASTSSCACVRRGNDTKQQKAREIRAEDAARRAAAPPRRAPSTNATHAAEERGARRGARASRILIAADTKLCAIVVVVVVVVK